MVLENSFEKYIGDESEINPTFIEHYLNHFYIHPIKNTVFKKQDEATALFREIMTTTLTRF